MFLRKGKHILCLFALFSCLFFAACSDIPYSLQNQTAENTTQNPAENYEFDMNMFIQQYNDALRSIENDEVIIEAPPEDLRLTDFALITLDPTFYSADFYAFLPLSSRALNKNEMLQLVQKMKSTSIAQLLSPMYSIIDSDITRRQNRNYYWEEYIRKINLVNEYRFNGVNPIYTLTNNPKDGNALCIETYNGDFLILPKNTMSDEQLLQIIQNEYRKIDDKYLHPLLDQIQYNDAASFAQLYAKQFDLIHQEQAAFLVKDYYTARSDTSTMNNLAPPDTWIVWMHYPQIEETKFDYAIYIDADSGDFIEWQIIPYGSFSEDEPEPVIPYSQNISRQKQDILDTAINYVNNTDYFRERSIIYANSNMIVYNTIFGASVDCYIQDENDRYFITVLMEDLAIYEVRKSQSKP